MPRIRVTRSAERVDRPTADFDAYPQPGVIAADASTSSPLFVTLPAAALMRGGEISVVNIGATGTVIVDTTGADTINGSATYTLAAQYDAVTVESLGGSPGWVVSTGGGGGGGGVTDHGALTGLGDDDHDLYEPTGTVLDATGTYTVVGETRLIMAAGGTVTLPAGSTRVANGERTLHLLVSADTTINVVGTDSILTVGQTVFETKAGSVLRLIPLDIGGTYLWVVGERSGVGGNIPEWYDTTTGAIVPASGETIVMGATGPEWTVGATDANHFLSGTGWTDNVPVLIPCKNTSAASISKGAPVYITGTVGSTPVIEIAPADADDPAKMPAIGLLDSTLAVNAFGYVVTQGIISGVDTSAYTINTPLYVSTTAGQLTSTVPVTGIQPMARAGRINASNGELIVVGAGTATSISPTSILGRPIGMTASQLASGITGGHPLVSSAQNSTNALALGEMRLSQTERSGVLNVLGVWVTATSLTAGQQVRVVCYKASPTTGLPTTLEWSESITVGTSTNFVSNTGLSLTVPPGAWVGVLNPSTNAGSVTVTAAQSATGSVFVGSGSRPTLQATSQGSTAASDVSAYTITSATAGATVFSAQQYGPQVIARLT